MGVLAQFRCIEANEPNSLADCIDGIAVDDVNVARFADVTGGISDLKGDVVGTLLNCADDLRNGMGRAA